jgi:hypothetical protein
VPAWVDPWCCSCSSCLGCRPVKGRWAGAAGVRGKGVWGLGRACKGWG